MYQSCQGTWPTEEATKRSVVIWDVTGNFESNPNSKIIPFSKKLAFYCTLKTVQQVKWHHFPRESRTGKNARDGHWELGEQIGNLKGNTVGTYWEPGKNDPFFTTSPLYGRLKVHSHLVLGTLVLRPLTPC
jgi:hypothetical protein